MGKTAATRNDDREPAVIREPDEDWSSIGPHFKNKRCPKRRAANPAAGPRRSGVSVKTSIVRVEVDARQNRAGSLANEAHVPKKVLVIDIGGTSVKLLVSGQHKRRMLSSGLRTQDDAGQDGP